MQTPIRQQYGPYQGILRAPFQGQQIQTQQFQHLFHHLWDGKHGHLYTGYQNPPYLGTQVPYYQKHPYPRMLLYVSKSIPSFKAILETLISRFLLWLLSNF